jgi:hypothetical protein
VELTYGSLGLIDTFPFPFVNQNRSYHGIGLDDTMASCWICLDDEADQYGKPPVRDCSCRGDDAGFSHVSCLVEYARRKSMEVDDDPMDFIVPWTNCPNCKQGYQH